MQSGLRLHTDLTRPKQEASHRPDQATSLGPIGRQRGLHSARLFHNRLNLLGCLHLRRHRPLQQLRVEFDGRRIHHEPAKQGSRLRFWCNSKIARMQRPESHTRIILFTPRPRMAGGCPYEAPNGHCLVNVSPRIPLITTHTPWKEVRVCTAGLVQCAL